MSKLEKYFQKALSRSPKATQKFLLGMPSSYWEKTKKTKALSIFKKAIKQVPAYKELLKINKIDTKKIKSITDFDSLPVTGKDNYLRQFDICDLISNETKDLMTVTVSSGSSGKPIYYPTSKSDLMAFPGGMITFFDYFWDIASKKRKALFINAMASGMWMGSVYGSYVFSQIAQKYRNISYINTGAEVDRVLDVLKMFASKYELIVLTTYPSFLRTIIDVAKQRNAKLSKINLKYISGGELLDDVTEEAFLKTFKTSQKESRLTAIFNAYGGTEIGNPGLATPLALMIKRICRKNKKLSKEIFGNENAQGTFFQQTPSGYVEGVGNSLLITKDGMMPVVRYNSGDTGEIFSYDQIIQILKKHNINIFKLLKENGFNKQSFKFPFLLMTGRSDWSVSFYGALVSPESIMSVILSHSEIRSFKIFDRSPLGKKIEFRIAVELNPGQSLNELYKQKLGKIISDDVLSYLLKHNFDFRDAYNIYMKVLTPKIDFIDFNQSIFEGEYQKKPKLVHA